MTVAHDRMREAEVARSSEAWGAALIILFVIVVITAAWWALALWPAGDIPPEWLARTRGACFGTAHDGLPSAGGWVLLIGEPVGMLGLLWAIWGEELRADLQRAWRSAWGRSALLGAAAVTVMGVAASGVRVARAMEARGARVNAGTGAVTRPGTILPVIALLDQHGTRAPLVARGAARTIVTVAFGDCESVCPTMVHDLLAFRTEIGRPDVPIVIITLDPWRDTPGRLEHIARQWGLAANDRVLSGSVSEVEAALDALGVGRARNERTGDIDHLATVLLLSAESRVLWRGDGGGEAMLKDASPLLASAGH
jgi:protein SCO1/2